MHVQPWRVVFIECARSVLHVAPERPLFPVFPLANFIGFASFGLSRSITPSFACDDVAAVCPPPPPHNPDRKGVIGVTTLKSLVLYDGHNALSLHTYGVPGHDVLFLLDCDLDELFSGASDPQRFP